MPARGRRWSEGNFIVEQLLELALAHVDHRGTREGGLDLAHTVAHALDQQRNFGQRPALAILGDVPCFGFGADDGDDLAAGRQPAFPDLGFERFGAGGGGGIIQRLPGAQLPSAWILIMSDYRR